MVQVFDKKSGEVVRSLGNNILASAWCTSQNIKAGYCRYFMKEDSLCNEREPLSFDCNIWG